MKLNLAFVLATLSLLGLVSINDSQPNKSSSAATLLSPKTQTINSQTGKAALDRKGRLLDKLKTLLEPLGITVDESALIDPGKVNTVRDLIIKWEAYPDISDELISAEKVKVHPVGREMKVIKRQKRQGSPLQLYGFQLTADDLFVAGIDTKAQLKWWTLITDPRILRGEGLGPNGEFIGETYHRTRPEIFLSAPDTKDITELWILKPQWTGTEYVLERFVVVPF